MCAGRELSYTLFVNKERKPSQATPFNVLISFPIFLCLGSRPAYVAYVYVGYQPMTWPRPSHVGEKQLLPLSLRGSSTGSGSFRGCSQHRWSTDTSASYEREEASGLIIYPEFLRLPSHKQDLKTPGRGSLRQRELGIYPGGSCV